MDAITLPSRHSSISSAQAAHSSYTNLNSSAGERFNKNIPSYEDVMAADEREKFWKRKSSLLDLDIAEPLIEEGSHQQQMPRTDSSVSYVLMSPGPGVSVRREERIDLDYVNVPSNTNLSPMKNNSNVTTKSVENFNDSDMEDYVDMTIKGDGLVLFEDSENTSTQKFLNRSMKSKDKK